MKDLARSVILHAIESGWPNPADLEQQALSGGWNPVVVEIGIES